jgi:hypothetical protein
MRPGARWLQPDVVEQRRARHKLRQRQAGARGERAAVRCGDSWSLVVGAHRAKGLETGRRGAASAARDGDARQRRAQAPSRRRRARSVGKRGAHGAGCAARAGGWCPGKGFPDSATRAASAAARGLRRRRSVETAQAYQRRRRGGGGAARAARPGCCAPKQKRGLSYALRFAASRGASAKPSLRRGALRCRCGAPARLRVESEKGCRKVSRRRFLVM